MTKSDERMTRVTAVFLGALYLFCAIVLDIPRIQGGEFGQGFWKAYSELGTGAEIILAVMFLWVGFGAWPSPRVVESESR